MSLSASEIRAIVEELTPLEGSRVDAVRVHAERALTLELFGRGGAARLLLSAEADLTRLHAASARPRAPDAPLPFQATLRRELEGASLARIELVSGDRVVALRFETASGPVRLVAELTGRHGNLFLVGADGRVRASAAPNLSRRRKLLPGFPYEPPAARAPGGDGPPRLAPVAGAPFPLSAAAEARYEALEAERRLAEARRRLREPLRAAIARAARALEKLADEAARVPAAEGDRRTADLLKANLRAVRRGQREVTVTEWTEQGAREVTLALDPTLGPRENMERYYRRYRRIAESAARVASRAQEVRRRAEAHSSLLAELAGAAPADLPHIEREARRLGAGPRPPPKPAARRDEPAPPYRTFASASGLPILVGRDAAGNDALTVRVARGNDLWLHARGRAGAHVVVKLPRGRAPDQETLLDAAHLAAHFSEARGEPQVDVAYTLTKHVRKPRGSAPGGVTFSQDRTILLRLEPERLERLLAFEGA